MVTSTPVHLTVEDRARWLSQAYTFDATVWLVEAGQAKLTDFSLQGLRYLSPEDGVQLVKRYHDLVQQEMEYRSALDVALAEAASGSTDVSEGLQSVQEEQEAIQLVAEGVLQRQASAILQANGLDTAGVVFPPLTFHFSELPMALIVSPRNAIQQDANILLDPDMSIEEQIQLEIAVESAMDVSALVVGIGGLGYYPTMVMETTSMSWIAEVIIHEWVHNFLDLRPLGMHYNTSPELRTMNETAANLIGKTFGALLIEEYYPEWAPQMPVEAAGHPGETTQAEEPVVFDFRLEMYITRLEVDRLLALGEVEAAEEYMEQRRLVFVDNGYPIRRLNQAYFAFHGAYADEGVSAAGEDPVGEAVRQLWAQSESPADFLRTIAWMDSYDDLLVELARIGGAMPASPAP